MTGMITPFFVLSFGTTYSHCGFPVPCFRVCRELCRLLHVPKKSWDWGMMYAFRMQLTELDEQPGLDWLALSLSTW